MVSKPLDSVNEFSSALWNEIENLLLISQKMRSAVPDTKLIAAFDADGTLWDQDAGEAFFQWQLDHCRLPNLPSDPWAHYRDWKKRDPHGAYAWLAQISSGVPLAQVRTWAAQCFEENSPWPVFASVRDLIGRLHHANFEVYVITASIKWSVEPAARALLGIPFERVLGIETETPLGRNGEETVSDRVKHPITYRQGKAEALLKATGGIKPLLAAGNTLGDISLLEIASEMKLMIQSQSPLASDHPGLVAEEKKLREHGRPLGWRLHAFRS